MHIPIALTHTLPCTVLPSCGYGLDTLTVLPPVCTVAKFKPMIIWGDLTNHLFVWFLLLLSLTLYAYVHCSGLESYGALGVLQKDLVHVFTIIEPYHILTC